MSETQDKDGRTEDATDKRLTDARLEGNIPSSRELANLAFLLAGISAAIGASTFATGRAAESLSTVFGHAADYRLVTGDDVIFLLSDLAFKLAIVIVPMLLMFTFAGVASSVIQNPPTLVWKRVIPDMSRVSPAKGFGRLTGMSGLGEFFKTTLRFWIMSAVGAWVVYSEWGLFTNTLQLGADGILVAWFTASLKVLVTLAIVSGGLTVLDWPLAHILWRRSLRMSHQEIKEEHKQAEGNAQLKARRLSIARARARRRMSKDVARATVVIANPTHFAVALRYVRQEGGAPKVVAKGQDAVALTIRRIAEERGIPVVEDKVLARSLYSKVEVDQLIPVEFYRVIAEIIIRLQSRQRSSITGRA